MSLEDAAAMPALSLPAWARRALIASITEPWPWLAASPLPFCMMRETFTLRAGEGEGYKSREVSYQGVLEYCGPVYV